MLKKILIASIIISAYICTNFLQAQEVGVGEIIFELPSQQHVTHGISIEEISYTLVRLHVNIAGKQTESINYQWEILDSIKKLEELTKRDIIQTLDLAKNKEEALNNYLIACEEQLQKGTIASLYLKQEMNIFKQNMEACLQDKAIYDKMYVDAMNRYDESIMQMALQNSIVYETCASKNRIQHNARINITRKLVFYLGMLQKKYDILFQKQDIITKNFEVFRDNILPELIEINNILQKYNF